MVAYSFKKRFVWPIKVGLGTAVPDSFGSPLPKRQTIRADRKRHARPGEELQHYCGMRTKSCFLIGRARCVSVQEIRLTFGTPEVRIGQGTPDFEVIRARDRLNEFATMDGFSHWDDMHEFWKSEHGDVRLGPFVGVLIRWTPLN